MKIWITKNSEVPVRDQIVSQIRVAIASGDLRPGDKLPSTRELARRFRVHANTVSAAYRELSLAGAVDNRKGSGIYIREDGLDQLDLLLERLFRDASKAGFSKDAVLERISNVFGKTKAGGFALFEPNEDLAEILTLEVGQATGVFPRRVTERDAPPIDSILIALFDEEAKIRQTFASENCIILSPNSVAGSLAGRVRPQNDELVAVVSGWEDFLRLSRMFLLAAGIDAGSICTCSTHESGWDRRLSAASIIICDSVTAAKIADDERKIVFPVVSANSLAELKRIAGGGIVAPSISIPNT